jgi:hypothetical protein
LGWSKAELGAEKIIIERKRPSADVKEWEQVAVLKGDAAKFIDRGLQPETNYEYRLLAENNAGRSEPARVSAVTTWADGFVEVVEDFAPAKANSENSLGQWTIVEANSHNLARSNEQGSSRSADAADGVLVTGYVPIRLNRAIMNEQVRVDLSGDAAQVSFDIQAQATTVFSPIFKLADGQWVMCGRTYTSSRYVWQTLTYDLHDPNLKWWLVDPKNLSRGNKELKVTRQMLEDVRGVGIYVEWVINQKWIKIDQYHLRGQHIKVESAK